MKEKEFDASLKSALENLDVPYEPASWDALQTRMDAAPPGSAPDDQATLEEAFDARIGRVLERLEAPYQPAYWQLLADRMVAGRRLRRRVWITKLAEAAIFLLLLCQLDGLFQGRNHDTLPWNREPVALTPAPSGQDQNDRPVRTGPGGHTATGPAGPAIAGSLAAPHLQSVDFLELPFQAVPGSAADRSTGQLAAGNLLLDPATETFHKQNLLTAFSALPTSVAVPEWQRAQLRLRPVVINRPRASRGFYAGTYAAVNQEIIRSGGDERPSEGYGGGLLAGYRPGPWGLEAGVGYSRQRYNPKPQLEIFDGNLYNGYYGSTIVTVDADVVDLPVRVTRRLARRGRTQIHATAGGTVHVALQKDYQYKTAFFPGSSQSNPSIPTASPQLQKKGKGLLEGGRVEDGNYAVTVQGGLRLEHSFGRLTGYVQPEYRQAMAGPGIGPKRNRLRGFSLQAGVIATL